MTWIVDPGHQPGGGCRGGGIVEADYVLELCEMSGCTLTRGDKLKYYTLRARDAVRSGVTHLLSVHCDSSSDTTRSRTAVFCRPADEPKVQRLVDGIRKLGRECHIVTNFDGYPNVESLCSFYESLGLRVAVLELGFLSNADDVSLLLTNEFKKGAAEAIRALVEGRA